MKLAVGKDPGKVTAGEHEATITDIQEIDTQYGSTLKFFFEITDMVNEEGDPPMVNGLCSAKLSPSTKLYKWLSERSELARQIIIDIHNRHSTTPYPEKGRCGRCRLIGSWERLTMKLYGGDPFNMAGIAGMPYVEPEFFRKGAGNWGGKPTW